MTIRRTCAFKGFTNAFWLNTIDIIYSKSGRQVVSNTESLSFFKIGFLFWGKQWWGGKRESKVCNEVSRQVPIADRNIGNCKPVLHPFLVLSTKCFKRSLQRAYPLNKRPRNNLIDFILKTYLLQIILFSADM